MFSRIPSPLLVCLLLGALSVSASAQDARNAEDDADRTADVSDDAAADASTDGSALPDVLKGGGEDVFPRVLGPIHLRADPRGQIPAQPDDMAEVLRRFFPTWRWELSPQTITLMPDDHSFRVEWSPEAGACYVALALDTSIADFESRQKASDGLAWWEAGADVDIQIRDLETDALIAEDLSRQLIPKVRWCSDGRPVRLDVRLGVPADAPPTVEVSWGVAVDASTLPPLRFMGDDALTQRLQWAQSVVTPRGRAQSAPAVFEVNGATRVHAHVRPPASGCDVLVAIGEASVQDIAIAHEDSSGQPSDFALFPFAAVPVCATPNSERKTQQLLIGVREGQGRIALQQFSFSR